VRRFQPVVHHPVQQRHGVRPALQRLAVQLEEQPLRRPQRGVGQLRPEPARLLGGVRGGLDEECGQQVALVLLDGPGDRHEQALAGAEVVDEHPVARARRRGQVTEAALPDAVARHVVEHGGQ
jgi:uncharacterized protein (DUF2336 family)